MSDATKTDLELLSIVIDGILSGALTIDDFVHPDHARLKQCWLWLIYALGRGPTDPHLVDVACELVRVDPSYPSGSFLLGLAFRKVGRNREAREAFVAQTAHPSGAMVTESKAMLATIES